jgi:small neutral amino acid transporter SnatA (MarC family)
MEQSAVTAAGVIDTFLVLLIGIGPKLALVPFLRITAPLDPATSQRVARRMLATAATVAFALGLVGRAAPHPAPF